jgi:hypothetical protein
VLETEADATVREVPKITECFTAVAVRSAFRGR